MGINNLVGRDMELKNHMTEEKSAPRRKRRGGTFFGLLALVFVFGTPFAAQAATLYDNQTGKTPSGSNIAGFLVSTFVATGSGTLTNVDMVNGSNSFHAGINGVMNLGTGTYGSGSDLDCQTTPVQHMGDWGVDVSGSYANPVPITPMQHYVFSGTQCAVTAGNSYYLHSAAWSSNSLTQGVNENSNPYVLIYAGSPTTDTSTRIDTVTPVGNSIVASSTSFVFGATGYLNPDDDDGDEWLRITASYNTPGEKNLIEQLLVPSTCFVGIPALWCLVGIHGQQGATGDFPITQGSISISTTTTLIDSGRYTMTTSIMKPYFSLFGFSIGSYTLVSTTTQFVIGALTASDKAYDYILQQNANFASTTVNLLSNCAIATFNLADCVTGFFIPNSQQLGDIWGQLRDGFLSAYPWGYVTRLATIVTGTATSSLPNLAISTPTTVNGKTFPIHASLNENVWSKLPGSGNSLLDTATSSDNKTFRQVVEPIYNSVVLVMFALALIPLVSGINIRGSDWSGYESESTTTGTNAKGQQYGSSQHTIGRRRKRDL